MKKRKLGYNELKSEEFIKIFNKMKNDKKLNFSLIVNGLDYNFECMALSGKISTDEEDFTSFPIDKLKEKMNEEKTKSPSDSSDSSDTVDVDTVSPSSSDCIDYTSNFDKCLGKI